jgi:hypothetical protein
MTPTSIRLQSDAVPRPIDRVTLRRQFINPLRSEWETGKGSIGIKSGARMMIVLRHPEFGFVVLVQHGSRAHPVGNALMADPPYAEGVAQPWGCDMTFPRSLFVNGERALMAVEHFLASGEEHPGLRWLPGDEFETGEPP